MKARPGTPVMVRVMARVAKQPGDGCWEWIGARKENGYASFTISRQGTVYVHRWMYEQMVGPIPDGLHIDHLCRVRHCVNPAHLEPVTKYENDMRGESWFAKNARKTHCANGHPYDEANTYMRPGGRERDCRRCKIEANSRWRQKKRAEAARVAA